MYYKKAENIISSNMDHLYNTQWKDIQQSDFKTWTQFMNKLRKLFHKLKETGQEVTQKSACIHLFKKVQMYLPIWCEVNEKHFIMNLDWEKCLQDLEA